MMKLSAICKAAIFAAGMLYAPQAHACQGIQFETVTIVFNDAPQAEVKPGFTQIKVTYDPLQPSLTESWPTKFSGRIAEGQHKGQRVMVALPPVTSCGSISGPNTGETYLIGRYVMTDDEPLRFAGNLLFTATGETKKSMSPQQN